MLRQAFFGLRQARALALSLLAAFMPFGAAAEDLLLDDFAGGMTARAEARAGENPKYRSLDWSRMVGAVGTAPLGNVRHYSSLIFEGTSQTVSTSRIGKEWYLVHQAASDTRGASVTSWDGSPDPANPHPAGLSSWLPPLPAISHVVLEDIAIRMPDGVNRPMAIKVALYDVDDPKTNKVLTASLLLTNSTEISRIPIAISEFKPEDPDAGAFSGKIAAITLTIDSGSTKGVYARVGAVRLMGPELRAHTPQAPAGVGEQSAAGEEVPEDLPLVPMPADSSAATVEATAVPVVTEAAVATATMTPSATSSPLVLATVSPSPSETPTRAPTETSSPTPTASVTPTYTPTEMPTLTATWTPTATGTATVLPVATSTSTATASPTGTSTPEPTATLTATPVATSTPVPLPSATAVAPTATATLTSTPESTSTPVSTPTRTATATKTPTATPTLSPTPVPKRASPTVTPSDTPTPEGTPFYGRCARNLDGKIVCVKFPGQGNSECRVSRDCDTPTPTPSPTVTFTPSPSPTPSLSCICACRAQEGQRNLVCVEPWVFRIARLSYSCPDQERGIFPWAFEREAGAVPAQRTEGYCGERWNGKEGAGYPDYSTRAPGIPCVLEQCRAGVPAAGVMP